MDKQDEKKVPNELNNGYMDAILHGITYSTKCKITGPRVKDEKGVPVKGANGKFETEFDPITLGINFDFSGCLLSQVVKMAVADRVIAFQNPTRKLGKEVVQALNNTTINVLESLKPKASTPATVHNAVVKMSEVGDVEGLEALQKKIQDQLKALQEKA